MGNAVQKTNYHIIRAMLFYSLLLLVTLFTSCTKPKNEETVIPPDTLFNTAFPGKDFDIIAVRQTNTSITFSILAYYTCDAKIEYGLQGGSISRQVVFSLIADVPKEILIDELQQSETYEYYFSYTTASSNQTKRSNKYSFETAKGPGLPFVFAIMADSHFDKNTDTNNYKRTLKNISEEDPDFLIDLGDTFMSDKFGDDFSLAIVNYLSQRYFLGQVCHSFAYYFVQGNHDGESGRYYDGTGQSDAVWSNQTRRKYFPMPEPDEFYSGNETSDPYCGLLQNYYAWEWSDALFIVLDPFWYSSANSMDDPWKRTLGSAQYEWLRSVLQMSTAKYRFVFIHNLVGGKDLNGKARGGAEVAGLYEWGGNSLDGQDDFASERPGWEMPIHDLLVKHHVNVVFHGHDHFYAYQSLDGIIYQGLPQPGASENAQPNQADEYGYTEGTFLSGTGYLKVIISSEGARVEYITTSVQNPDNNKKVVHSYWVN